MGKTFSDVCVPKRIQEENINLSRDFQKKGVTFPSNIFTKEALNSNTVSDGNSSQNTDWLWSGSIPSTTKKLDANTPSSSVGYLQYSGSTYDSAEKYFSYLRSSLSFAGDLDIAEGDVTSTPGNYSNPNVNSISRRETEYEKKSTIAPSLPPMKRIQLNATEFKPVDPPGGKFVIEKQFYIQNSESQWEVVNLERWNSWNGTWQVKGEDSDSFPVAPIELKSKEQYEFVSRAPKVKPRSFVIVS